MIGPASRTAPGTFSVLSTTANADQQSRPAAIVVMGVSGCGKSTVGKALAERLGASFVDGDDLHPPANTLKMAAGVPLSDEDREPWLGAVHEWLEESTARGSAAVVACSALKRAYRDVIRGSRKDVVFVHLIAERESVIRRVAERAEHFMPASLVGSQFEALEPLQEDEPGADFSTSVPAELVVSQVSRWLGQRHFVDLAAPSFRWESAGVGIWVTRQDDRTPVAIVEQRWGVGFVTTLVNGTRLDLAPSFEAADDQLRRYLSGTPRRAR